ncbi:MAG TPA: STAS domain-containing protein [Herpetosiphonaceae bacterium]
MDPSDGSIDALRAENARLRQRLQALESPAPDDLAPLLGPLLRKLPLKIDIWRADDPADMESLRLVYSNGWTTPLTKDISQHMGKRIREALPWVQAPVLAKYAEVLRDGQPAHMTELRVALPEGGEEIANLEAIPLSERHLCVLVEDVTAQHQAAEAQRQVQEQQAVIRAQQLALAELSTPLIPITDQVMVMPLIGAIDSRRAQLVMENLLRGISEQRASVVILDITGVPIVDTQVANALIQSAQAVKLLGAHVVLTGIRPEVAQTLVGLGVNLNEIITMSNVQGGIAYATANRRS